MKQNIATIITIIAMACFLSACEDEKNEQIRKAVEYQLDMYPKITFQDLYKSFFQDYFGPGHAIGDTLSAGLYLDSELALVEQSELTYFPCGTIEQSSTVYYEPTGYNGNFYRVHLSVIKDGLIPRDVFFDAFLRSVSDIKTISFEEWKKEWKKIDGVINKMNLSLDNYEQDREEIFSLLEQGEYVVHHSDLFYDEYNFRYRIIVREIFEKEFLPILP